MSASQVERFEGQERLPALVFLPSGEFTELEPYRQGHLLFTLQSALDAYGVDAAYVFDFPQGAPNRAETVSAIESKWRPRATTSPHDDDSIPAGFVEVRR